MKVFIISAVVFLISSIITLAITFLKIPPNILLRVIAVLLIFILILSNLFIFSGRKNKTGLWQKTLLTLLSALFVQILILATGGFYSPFLIMIHLYTLGASFLISLPASVSFLVLAVITVVVNIVLSQEALVIFQNDPWSTILYIVSFIAIIPLSYILVRSYNLKDSLTKVLNEHLQIGQKREESILKGLTDLVVITDQNLTVLFANDPFLLVTNQSLAQIVRKPIFDILPMKDQDGSPPTQKGLSIDNIFQDKTTRIVNGYFMPLTLDMDPSPLSIQVRPVLDLNGNITQIVFVITQAVQTQSSGDKHNNLEFAKARHRTLMQDIRSATEIQKSPALLAKLGFLNRVEEDLTQAIEIEDHQIKESHSFADIAQLCQEITVLKLPFAKIFNCNLQFVLPDSEMAERSLLQLQGSTIPQTALPTSNFSMAFVKKSVRVIIDELLNIGILLSSNQPTPYVQLVAYHNAMGDVEIVVWAICQEISNFDYKKDIFTEYYGSLGEVTNLKYGSGLEGFITKRIADQLKIPVNVQYDVASQRINFILTFSKSPN